MSSSTVSKKPHQAAAPSKGSHSGAVDNREHSTKASASVCVHGYPMYDFALLTYRVIPKAGLNLNVFGALSGVFSGNSKKETAADGSSVEYRDDKAAVKGWFR
jgi:hypothetical protein